MRKADRIRQWAVEQAKTTLHIAYGHTSHGSQLISGMGASGTELDAFMTANGASFFDVVVSCDDTDKHKPDPTPVLITLERLGSLPERSIMLGDTMFDILCARNAGVLSVLVGWAIALGPEEIEGPQGPDFVIHDAMDLFSIL